MSLILAAFGEQACLSLLVFALIFSHMPGALCTPFNLKEVVKLKIRRCIIVHQVYNEALNFY